MKGFLHTGCTIFQMVEISEAEMDALIARAGRLVGLAAFWLYLRQRMWPRPPKRAEAFFYD